MGISQSRPPLWRTQAQNAVAGGFGANGAQQPAPGAAPKAYNFGNPPPPPSMPQTATQNLAGAGSGAADMAKQAMMKMTQQMQPPGASMRQGIPMGTPEQIQQANAAKSMTDGMFGAPKAMQQPSQQLQQQLRADLQGQQMPMQDGAQGPMQRPMQQQLRPLQPLRPLNPAQGQMQGQMQPYSFGRGGY